MKKGKKISIVRTATGFAKSCPDPSCGEEEEEEEGKETFIFFRLITRLCTGDVESTIPTIALCAL